MRLRRISCLLGNGDSELIVQFLEHGRVEIGGVVADRLGQTLQLGKRAAASEAQRGARPVKVVPHGFHAVSERSESLGGWQLHTEHAQLTTPLDSVLDEILHELPLVGDGHPRHDQGRKEFWFKMQFTIVEEAHNLKIRIANCTVR